MALIKPTRRELISLAVHTAKSQIQDEITKLEKDKKNLDRRIKHAVDAWTDQDSTAAKAVFQNLATELQAVLDKHGMLEKVSHYAFSGIPSQNKPAMIHLNINISRLSPHTPEPFPEKVETLRQEITTIDQQINALQKKRNGMTEDNVLRGMIAQALDERAEKALDAFVALIKEVDVK